MTFQTFERFQGLWWGGIIGQIVSHRSLLSQGKTTDSLGMISEFYSWIEERRTLASLSLEGARVDVNALQKHLQIRYDSGPQSQIDTLEPTQPLPLKNPIQVNLLLTLIPLIFISGDGQDMLRIIGAEDQTAVMWEENSLLCGDLLIWQSLLKFILFANFPAANLIAQFNKISSNFFQDTRLLVLFKLVNQHIQQGLSLQQLVEIVKSECNYNHRIVCLAWYCFATTPQDPRLSLGRTITLPHSLQGMVAALTGTLSGAYNGMTSIPWNWRRQIKDYSDSVAEEQTIKRLVQHWLGAYDPGSKLDFYSQGLLAPVRMIQPRQNLSIISQSTN